MQKLLSPAELAEMCGVPLGTVYRWNHNGTGPEVLHIGKHVRYHPDAVKRWLDAQATSRQPA